MLWVEASVHWLHLMAAILWVGGTLAVSLVVQPVLRAGLEETERLRLYRGLARRLGVVQWASWAVLAATGLWKLKGLGAAPAPFSGAFGRVLAVKLVLVAAMAALSLAHSAVWGPALLDGNLEPGERSALVRRMAFWGRVNGALLAAIVYCAALLRFNPW